MRPHIVAKTQPVQRRHAIRHQDDAHAVAFNLWVTFSTLDVAVGVAERPGQRQAGDAGADDENPGHRLSGDPLAVRACEEITLTAEAAETAERNP